MTAADLPALESALQTALAPLVAQGVSLRLGPGPDPTDEIGRAHV